MSALKVVFLCLIVLGLSVVEASVCGIASVDTDGDGTPDCADGCPIDFNKITPGLCGCGVTDTLIDMNSDGTPDCQNGAEPAWPDIQYAS